MNTHLIQAYSDRLINQNTKYVKQFIAPDGQFRLYTSKPDDKNYAPLDLQLIEKMLYGQVTIGLPSVDEQMCSKWLAFDDDTDTGARDRLQEALRSWGWHCIPEGKRPGRGGHLWLLFDEPVSASALVVLADAMLRLALVKIPGMEFFPKYGKSFSALRAPLSIHRKLGANNIRGWFELAPQNIECQLEWLSNQPLNRAEDARTEAAKHRPKPARILYRPSGATTSSRERVNLLEALEHRRKGNEYWAQCPACALEGGDTHKDNLRISLDGAKFCCVKDGPGQRHKAKDIINALRCVALQKV